MSISELGPSVPSEIPFSLGRNAACHRCRRRKMRCDAVRPVCSNCRKLVQKKRLEGTVCTWDEKKDTRSKSVGKKTDTAGSSRSTDLGTQTASSSSGSRQIAIVGSQAPSQSSSDYGQSSKSSSKESSSLGGSKAPSVDRSLSRNFPAVPAYTSIGQAAAQQLLEPPTIPLPVSPTWSPLSQTYEVDTRHVQTSSTVTAGALDWPEDTEATEDEDDEPMDDIVVPPDWPKELPSPTTVRAVCKLFFDHVPTLPKMIHRSTFFKTLRRHPSSEESPAQYLLHAILAISSPHLPQSAAYDRAYFPVGTPASRAIHPTINFSDLPMPLQTLDGSRAANRPLADFVLWHRHQALSISSRIPSDGAKGVQAVQTRCIVAALDRVNVWWTDTGQETMALHQSALFLRRDSGQAKNDNTYDLSQAIRDRTRWICWLTEREIGISSAPADRSLDGIEFLDLPVIQKRFDAGRPPLRGVQTFRSIDIFSNSPREHLDGLSYLIKSVKLFSNVKEYYYQFSQGSYTISDFLSHSTFKHLIVHINSMRASSPKPVGRPTQTFVRGAEKLDVDLIAAVMITNLATFTLLEPCITTELYKSSLVQEAVSAIRGVINMVQDVHNSGFDITSLPSFCPLVWSLCARGLIKLIILAKSFGDALGAGMYHSELEVFRLSLIRYGQRHPIAGRYLKELEDDLQRLRTPRDIGRQGAPTRSPSQAMGSQTQQGQPPSFAQMPLSYPFLGHPGPILSSTNTHVEVPQAQRTVFNENATSEGRPRTAYDWAQALPPLSSPTSFVERYNFGPYYNGPPMQQHAQLEGSGVAAGTMHEGLPTLDVPGSGDRNTGMVSGSVGDGLYGSFWSTEPSIAGSSISGMLSTPTMPPSSLASPVNMLNIMSLAGQNQNQAGQDTSGIMINPTMQEELAGLDQWLNLLSQSPREQRPS